MIGAFPHTDDEVFFVFADGSGEAAGLMLAVFEDEGVLVLRVADGVVVDFVKVVRLLEVAALFGLRIAGIKESFVV